MLARADACCCTDCWLLTACNGTSPSILTGTDLSAYEGGVVLLDDYITVASHACDGSEVEVTVLSGTNTDTCDDCELGPDCGSCCDAGTTPLYVIVNVPLIDTGLDCTGGSAELLGPARVVFSSNPSCWTCVTGIQDTALAQAADPGGCCGVIEYIDPADETHPECAGTCWTGTLVFGGDCTVQFQLSDGFFTITWRSVASIAGDCFSTLNGFSIPYFSSSIGGAPAAGPVTLSIA